jgi:hypothetical protein
LQNGGSKQNDILEGREQHCQSKLFQFYICLEKQIIAIISALQMAQVVNSSKSKVEIILDVSHLNLALCMAIMFLVHALHLSRVTIGIASRGEFKQNIIIKCGRNAMNILNAKLIIIQISRLGANMHGKQHLLKNNLLPSTQRECLKWNIGNK